MWVGGVARKLLLVRPTGKRKGRKASPPSCWRTAHHTSKPFGSGVFFSFGEGLELWFWWWPAGLDGRFDSLGLAGKLEKLPRSVQLWVADLVLSFTACRFDRLSGSDKIEKLP